MGIITNVKSYLAGKVVSAARKTGDGIATLSSLSPKQLNDMDDRRKNYLGNKPDPSSKDVQQIIEKNMGAIGVEVYQAYLSQLSRIYYPIDMDLELFDEDNRIRFFNITKWVTDPEEKSLDKLVNVYQVLSEEDCNIALIYHRTQIGTYVTIGVVNTSDGDSDPSIADNYYSRIESAMRGNFPGVDIEGLGSKSRDYGVGFPDCLKSVHLGLGDNKAKSVAIVSNIASEKSTDFISQSMEKLLDGIIPTSESEEYIIVLLAKPVSNQLEMKNRLFELYTALSPYASWQTGYTYTESDGVNSSANVGVNLGVGAGINSSTNVSVGVPIDGIMFSAGASQGYHVSANFGASFARASSVTAQVGKNESITQTFVNHGVKHTLEIIDNQIKRIEESSALGMWEFASYIISDSPIVANNVAHMYLALTQGEESFISKASINLWDGDIESDEARVILSSVVRLQHPLFGLKTSLADDWLMYPTLVTPTAPLSGKELAKALNFPRKSVNGLPVYEVVPFGREPKSLLNDNVPDIELGYGYHMRKIVYTQRIKISKEELTKHTFISGSTGSGKTNTIYRLLEKLSENQVRFLVVEPAKGEYKDEIGKQKGVVTYGTNPNDSKVDLLRINPFKFPKSIHILEHLDRLIEIFNACWPMYAAMPAILKDSVERAYVNCGWDLTLSKNDISPDLFPGFSDVVREIKTVLVESDYSADNKGDYTGALVTRLNSLTNGLNGLIFTPDDIDDKNIFDNDAIVDLSKVGSTETKSLIMGFLVLKLHEHRMDQRDGGANTNDSLKHVTVLEEAHHLLKRTSSDQSADSANLTGKAVEMLANSIAEMRTYGEGFIIADQSPGLLDMSVIRNTNTKIILRLLDYSDRLLVGKAAGLSDAQIEEISKLEKGVAAISQSDWIEPVLCKIDKFSGKDKDTINCDERKSKSTEIDDKILTKYLLDIIVGCELYRNVDRIDVDKLKTQVIRSGFESIVKAEFIQYLQAEGDEAISALRKLSYDFLHAGRAFNIAAKQYPDINQLVHSFIDELSPSVSAYSKSQIDSLISLLLYEQQIRDASTTDVLCRFTQLYKQQGGVY